MIYRQGWICWDCSRRHQFGTITESHENPFTAELIYRKEGLLTEMVHYDSFDCACEEVFPRIEH
jgi:hypothetical protein